MPAAAPPRASRRAPRPTPGPGSAFTRAPRARPGPAAAPPVLCYSRGRRGRSESKPGWIPEPLRDRPAPAGFRRRGLGLRPGCPTSVPRARPAPTARHEPGPRQPAPGRPLAGSAPPARPRLGRCAPLRQKSGPAWLRAQVPTLPSQLPGRLTRFSGAAQGGALVSSPFGV